MKLLLREYGKLRYIFYAKDIKTFTNINQEKVRGPSLIDQHQKGIGADVEEDDPSKRAFDKEKDMASGTHVGHAQRKEMLNRASGFSSKFTSGSYL